MKIIKAFVIFATILVMVFFDVTSTFEARATDWTQVTTPFGSMDNLMFSTERYNDNVYAGTYRENGGRIYKTSDGANWTQIGEDGFGDLNNIVILPGLSFDWGFLGFGGFKGAHYAGTANANGLQIWRSSDDITWTQVAANGFDSVDNYFPMGSAIFNDDLYVATWNETGTEIWRSTDGQTWTQVNEDGFGDTDNFYTSEMHIYNNYLYVFTGNWDGGGEIWRSANGTDWTEIEYPGLTDGWNWSFDCNTDYNGEMYVGTTNLFGGQLWKTSNGTNWTQITGPGFLKSENIGINPLGVEYGYLYLGTYNLGTIIPSMKLLGIDTSKYENKLKQYSAKMFEAGSGGEVWATNDGSSWSQINNSGFGDPGNVSINSYFPIGENIYIWTFNIDPDYEYIGTEMWRSKMLGLPSSSSPSSTLSSTSAADSTISTLPRTGRKH